MVFRLNMAVPKSPSVEDGKAIGRMLCGRRAPIIRLAKPTDPMGKLWVILDFK
jgi:hypothetical protein